MPTDREADAAFLRGVGIEPVELADVLTRDLTVIALMIDGKIIAKGRL